MMMKEDSHEERGSRAPACSRGIADEGTKPSFAGAEAIIPFLSLLPRHTDLLDIFFSREVLYPEESIITALMCS